jgi:hypothetical protein
MVFAPLRLSLFVEDSAVFTHVLYNKDNCLLDKNNLELALEAGFLKPRSFAKHITILLNSASR